MTKPEIIARFEELLQAEDITTVKQEIRQLQEQFKTAGDAEEPTAELAETPMEEPVEAETPEITETTENPETSEESDIADSASDSSSDSNNETSEDTPDSEPQTAPAKVVNPIDAKFRQLNNEFFGRLKKHGEMLERQREQNRLVKEGLIEELKALAENPDPHYKTLFQDFNRINETWKNTGHVPMEFVRDINERFYHWKNVFFHDFRIHVELRELDVKKNREGREAIIGDISSLQGIERINELIAAVDAIKSKWNEEGPVPPDLYKELADKFYGTLREYEDRIRAHFQSLREEQEQNVLAKESLIARATEAANSDGKSHDEWKVLTEKVIALQNEWKTIGFVKRDRDDLLYKTFREACDGFFKAKDAFYKKADAEMEGRVAEKKGLIEQARALQDSTSWGATAKEIQQIMEKWKSIGGIKRGIDNKLWAQLREAIDKFYERKKAHFGDRHAEQENNLFKKNELITEAENFTLSGDRNADLAKLKEFNERWNEIGFVPKNDIDGVIKRFRAALDKHYKSLDASAEEQQLARFREKFDRGGSDNGAGIEREQRFLRDKIGKLKDEILQYESNIAIFTGKGAAELHKEIQKKIRNAEREIDQIKKKLDLLKSMKAGETSGE